MVRGWVDALVLAPDYVRLNLSWASLRFCSLAVSFA